MAVLGFLVFAAAFGASAWVMAATLVPAMPRMIVLLTGDGEPVRMLQPALSVARRRVRPAAMPVSRPTPWRAAA